MWERIHNEIDNHCAQCSQECSYNCVVFRIKNIVTSIFDPSKINIDDFFEGKETRQHSIFDITEGWEI